jgi:predicted Holliday junction resolvase-like endonuclease
MNKFKKILSNPKFSALVIALLALVIAASAATIQIKAQEMKANKVALEKANAQVAELTNDVGTATAEREQLTKEKSELLIKNEEQRAALEAFAKQAASCNSIKKQLKFKN